jgi:hypothetical protein
LTSFEDIETGQQGVSGNLDSERLLSIAQEGMELYHEGLSLSEQTSSVIDAISECAPWLQTSEIRRIASEYAMLACRIQVVVINTIREIDDLTLTLDVGRRMADTLARLDKSSEMLLTLFFPARHQACKDLEYRKKDTDK